MTDLLPSERDGEPPGEAIDWPLVLAVVVAHNGRKWLAGCLKSLAMQSYPALEVVVVDNASTDPEGVQRLIQRLLPAASILRLARNVGFGAAANRALELAPDARVADYYLFLHDDVALDRECISLLVASALETDAGVVGGKGLSWDQPEVLLEVGMSADEFGYPVSGLEEGEIDQSQHDVRREVLFVTSACILVSRATVERCGSWDGAYFLFGEDLDLCIRARLCGFPVVVAPEARFYHAVAMATGRREDPPAEPIRYFTRRNRLRTIAKNASATRVLFLFALYSVVLLAEVVLLAVLRRFDEIPPYVRAYGAFFRTLPDVARRRRAVQRRREVPDRRVRRYMVRDLPRVRIFLERRLMAWGEETLRLGQRTFSAFTPTALADRMGRIGSSPGAMGALLVGVVLLGAGRHVLLGPPIGAGTLWPFPAATHRLLTDYLAAWREVGLGSTAVAAPALPLYWVVNIAALGNAALAQKFLVGGLLLGGLFGMYRFVRRRTSVALAPAVAVGLYALAPLIRLTMISADLGALALFAFGPAMLDAVLHMLGPSPAAAPGPTPGTHALRPALPGTVDAMTRQSVRLGLMTAAVLALAPSALPAIVVVWLLAGLATLTTREPRAEAGRRLVWVLASVVVALVLLLPWSLPALAPHGAMLSALFGGPGGGANLAPAWASMDFAHATLVIPGVSLLAGVVTLAALVGSMLIASTSRRREVRFLAGVIIAFGLWTGFVAKGWFPAPVATPALWLIFPLIGLAVAGGYLLAALKEDVPRHAAGWRQTLGAAAAVVFVLALLTGWVPALASWDAPPASAVAGTGSQAQTGPLAAVRGAAVGAPEFRVLWLGSSFVDPVRVAVHPKVGVPFLLTGPDGLTVLDDLPVPTGAAGAWLSGAVNDVVGGRTHLGGHLLAPAGVRFLVVDRQDAAITAAVLRQADFALNQQLGSVDIYQNREALPVAGVLPDPLAAAGVTSAARPLGLLEADWNAPPAAARISQGAFKGAVSQSDVVLLAEAYSSGWRASVGGRVLTHAKAFGWANSFTVPADAHDAAGVGSGLPLSIDYRGEWRRVVWVVVEALLVALAVAMATVGRVARTGGRSESAGARPRVMPGPLAQVVNPSRRHREAARTRGSRVGSQAWPEEDEMGDTFSRGSRGKRRGGAEERPAAPSVPRPGELRPPGSRPPLSKRPTMKLPALKPPQFRSFPRPSGSKSSGSKPSASKPSGSQPGAGSGRPGSAGSRGSVPGRPGPGGTQPGGSSAAPWRRPDPGDPTRPASSGEPPRPPKPPRGT